MLRRLLVAPAMVAMAARAAPSIPSRTMAIGQPSPIYRFDIKKYKMEQRRLRELEKAGIDPDDDEPWIAPEEQERIDEEEQQRKAEEEERRKAYLEKRDAEAELKRQRFKEFRAKQISMSKRRKEEIASNKAAARAARGAEREEVADEASTPEGDEEERK